MGYKLTAAGPGPSGDGLLLVYGSCERPRGQTSCTPPLVVWNWGPNPNRPGGWSPAGPHVRGLTTSGDGAGSTTLWTQGSMAIEVQSNTDIRDEIVQALVIANAGLFGLPDVRPGESLEALNQWSS